MEMIHYFCAASLYNVDLVALNSQSIKQSINQCWFSFLQTAPWDSKYLGCNGENIFFLILKSNENSCIICINHHIDTSMHIQSCTNEDTRVNEVWALVSKLSQRMRWKTELIWFDFWCFNATFSNISAISWRAVLAVEEAGENHRPRASNW